MLCLYLKTLLGKESIDRLGEQVGDPAEATDATLLVFGRLTMRGR